MGLRAQEGDDGGEDRSEAAGDVDRGAGGDRGDAARGAHDLRPVHRGRSHCEEEFTAIEDIEGAANTLFLAALDLAGGA